MIDVSKESDFKGNSIYINGLRYSRIASKCDCGEDGFAILDCKFPALCWDCVKKRIVEDVDDAIYSIKLKHQRHIHEHKMKN